MDERFSQAKSFCYTGFPLTPNVIPGQSQQGPPGEVHLVYKIEGSPNDVPLFELSRTLEAIGCLIEEGDRVVSADTHTVRARVAPFEQGSFVMDLVLSIRNDPALLFFLSQPDAIARIKQVLEYLGLIKKGKEMLTSLLELVKHLRSGKPQKVEQAGADRFVYYNNSGEQLTVNGTVHQMVNNTVIQNYYFSALGSPLEREGVEGLSTFLKDAQEQTKQFLPKSDAPSLKAFSDPGNDKSGIEVVENITTEFLNPKAGTYGEAEGLWTFSRAGTPSSQIKAKISDSQFLAKYQHGAIRFYRNDLLKVRLRQEQTVKAGKATVKYEILEVLDYTKAPSRPNRRRSDE